MLLASNLNKSYGRKPVLKELSLGLNPGELLGLVGVNGSGKSTLLHILAGLIVPDSGNVSLFGENPRIASNAALAQMAFVGQGHHALNHLSAERYLRYIGSLYPGFDLGYALTLLAKLDVPPLQAMLGFSLGQRQRVEVVRALSVRPALLLLDEPLSAIDPAGRRQIIDEILNIAHQHGAAVLLTTHVFSDIEHSSVELALLMRGKIALRERIDTLKKFYVRIQIDEIELPGFLQGKQARALPGRGWTATLRREEIPTPNRTELTVHEPSLEDIYLALSA